MKPEHLNALIRSRRSVFPDQFIQGKKIDDTIIQEIITNATWAPNHGRQEPWQFSIFTGGGLKKLADFQSALYKRDAGVKFKEGSYQKLQTNPLRSSHLIAIGMKLTTTKNIQ